MLWYILWCFLSVCSVNDLQDSATDPGLGTHWTDSKRMESNAFCIRVYVISLSCSLFGYPCVLRLLWRIACCHWETRHRVSRVLSTNYFMTRFNRRATLRERRVVVSDDGEDATLLESRECAASSATLSISFHRFRIWSFQILESTFLLSFFSSPRKFLFRLSRAGRLQSCWDVIVFYHLDYVD